MPVSTTAKGMRGYKPRRLDVKPGEEITPADRKRGEEAMIEEEQRKYREAGDTAPTTKTDMGKMFANGGYVKAADGIAQRGKTRGKMC
jgi:hypothetical protein